MAKTIEPVTGQTGEYADYNGKYVDYIFSEEQKEEITTSEDTHFFDPTIIPTVQYQVYGLDNVWFWDNEGQNYTFDQSGKLSTISIQVVAGIEKTYYKVGSLELGDEVTGAATAPEGGIPVDDYPSDLSNATVGQIYYKVVSGTPDTYNYKEVVATSFDETSDDEDKKHDKGVIESAENAPVGSKANDVFHTEEEILDPSDAEEVDPYEFNKYGKEEMGKDILVTIEPNSDLSNSFPRAIVTINGKEHDLAYLDNPIRLYMDRDYRISINWVWGSIVETFRIICNR